MPFKTLFFPHGRTPPSDKLPVSSSGMHSTEEEPIRRNTNTRSITNHLKDDIAVTSRLLETELYLLALAIGIQDAISFPDFHCFASNQTGNTVLFAVGILLDPALKDASGVQEKSLFSVATIAVSLALFIAGVLVTGQVANYFKMTHKRGWLILSNAISTGLVYLASAIQWRYNSEVGDDTTLGRVIIGILAFSSGSQVAAVRGLKVTDITTAMATAAYIDIFIDPKLLAKLSANRGRNRRIVFLLMMVAGSFVGAGVGSRTNFGVAMLVSAIVKSIVTVMFWFNTKLQVEGGNVVACEGV